MLARPTQEAYCACRTELRCSSWSHGSGESCEPRHDGHAHATKLSTALLSTPSFRGHPRILLWIKYKIAPGSLTALPGSNRKDFVREKLFGSRDRAKR